MIVTVSSGRASSAVLPCGARIILTVFDTTNSLPVANTQVFVITVTDASGRQETEQQTDAQGMLTLNIADAPELFSQEELTIEVASRNGTELDRVHFPPVAKGTTSEAAAYFGMVLELDVLYRKIERLTDERQARHTLHPERDDGQSIVNIDGSPDLELIVADGHSLIDENLLASGAQISKPQDYTNRNWNRHIRTTLQFDVRVTQRRRMEKVPIGAQDFVIEWEVIDPPSTWMPENKPMSDGRPVTWLQNFHAAHVHSQFISTHAYEGGNNCPQRFGGQRSDNAGVPARDVLFGALDGAQLVATAIPHAGCSAGGYDEAAQCWISSVLFRPDLIGGDRYFFTVSLRRPDGTVLRFDHKLKGPQLDHIRTVNFTLWRQIAFAHEYKLPAVAGTFNWEVIERTYAAAYIKIARGEEYEIREDDIRPLVIDACKVSDVVLLPSDPIPHGVLLPKGININKVAETGKNLIRKVVAMMVKRHCPANFSMTPDQKDGGHNFWMLCCNELARDTDLAGEYCENGLFYMVFKHDFSLTLAHELGHALYLRHSLTDLSRPRTPTGSWNGGDRPKVSIAPQENIFDHVPSDAVCCVMSYANSCFKTDGFLTDYPVAWHFCALCLLKLRFWDTNLFAQEQWFQDEIRGEMLAATPVPVLAQDHRDFTCQNVDCAQCHFVDGGPWIGNVGAQLRLYALILPDPTTNESGEQCWVDLALAAGCTLDITNPGIATPVAEIPLALNLIAPGQTTVTCSYLGAVSAAVTISVSLDHWAVHGRPVYRTLAGANGLAEQFTQIDFTDSEDAVQTFRINGNRFHLRAANNMVSPGLEMIQHKGHDNGIWSTTIGEHGFISEPSEGASLAVQSKHVLRYCDGQHRYELLLEPPPPLQAEVEIEAVAEAIQENVPAAAVAQVAWAEEPEQKWDRAPTKPDVEDHEWD